MVEPLEWLNLIVVDGAGVEGMTRTIVSPSLFGLDEVSQSGDVGMNVLRLSVRILLTIMFDEDNGCYAPRFTPLP